MTLSEELTWRGFVNQMTLGDITELDNKKLSFYWGVDPSADSLQIGNLAAAIMVKHFIDAGHSAYLLVGGATGFIGDPDGKKSERNLKTVEEINKNKAGIIAQYKKIFAGKDFTIVDNYDWFKDINYIDFLRDIGKKVPMSQMLGRDFVQSRLGSDGTGISYAEFSYSLIQAYDFLYLFRKHGVSLQVAASDQWGNSMAGVDLIRRIEGKQVHVYTTPLIINRTTGIKFGKSEGGAIWIDPAKTTVYKFYQFWLNIDDIGVIDYLKTYTLLSREEIEDLSRKQISNPGERPAQKALAHEVSNLVHGTDRTESVERVNQVLFGGSDINQLSQSDLEILSEEIATINQGATVIESLNISGISNSNSDANRLIKSGAISINGQKINQDKKVNELAIIKKGKNNFVLVR